MSRRKIVHMVQDPGDVPRPLPGRGGRRGALEATVLARRMGDAQVLAFEKEGEVTEGALQQVVEAAATVAAQWAMTDVHHVATKEAVKTMAMEAATASLCEIRHDAAMTTLEEVAKEAAKSAIRELRQAVKARSDAKEARHEHVVNSAAAEEHVALAAEAAAASGLVDANDTEEAVDDDEGEEVDQLEAPLAVPMQIVRALGFGPNGALTPAPSPAEVLAQQEARDH